MKKIILWIGIIGINITLNAQETVQGINFHAEHSSYNSSGIHDSHINQWNRLSLALKSENNSFRIEDWTLGSSNVTTIFSANTNGKVGIGTISPSQKLEVNGGSIAAYNSSNTYIIAGLNAQSHFRIGYDGTGGVLESFLNNTNSGTHIKFNTGLLTRMIITEDGTVGIGTTDTKDFKLGVKGKIAAEEVKVAVYNNWSDFVFEKEYDLPTLTEVENHIIEKGHLKDIPSAKEVAENGIYLGEMDSKLLQKIEELMLYTINQEKKIKSLEVQNKEIQLLKKENKSLWNRLNKIEELLNKKD